MSEKLSELLESDGKTHRSWLFRCPGCEFPHQCDNRWIWNGSKEAPTFDGSVLVRREYGEERVKQVCHSYVREGRIEFLSDSTHALAGKTVDLPSWDRT